MYFKYANILQKLEFTITNIDQSIFDNTDQ